MQKLLALYLTKPTETNATRVALYAEKHPMSTVALNHLEHGVLKAARMQFWTRTLFVAA